MTTSRRRLDWASLALLVVGVVCSIIAYLDIRDGLIDPLCLIPGTVATTTGGTHLFKREATRK